MNTAETTKAEGGGSRADRPLLGFRTEAEKLRDLQTQNAALLAALKNLMAATQANSRWCPACACNVNLEHKEHYEPCSWTQACVAIAAEEAVDL